MKNSEPTNSKIAGLPKTFQHCIRCDKDVTHEPIHTCTPSAKYRAGMEEGAKKANAKLEKALAFIEEIAERVCTRQHENKYGVPKNQCEICKARELLKELTEGE